VTLQTSSLLSIDCMGDRTFNNRPTASESILLVTMHKIPTLMMQIRFNAMTHITNVYIKVNIFYEV